MFFPLYRLAVLAVAVAVAIALWIMVDWTRLGAMIRAGVDDPPIARVCGIKVSQLFTLVFCLGAALAAFAGVMGAPFLSVYPGLDFEMLPLALIVVILGGTGSLLGALVGSFILGFLYNFGQAMFPDLAYVILFLPMLLDPGAAPARPVRPGRGMSGRLRYAAIAVALAPARHAALVGRQHLLHQHREPDPAVRGVRARAQCAGRLRRPGLARPRRPVRHRRLYRGAAVAGAVTAISPPTAPPSS